MLVETAAWVILTALALTSVWLHFATGWIMGMSRGRRTR